MSQLRDACVAAGLEDVQTVSATGNLLFRSGMPESRLVGVLADVIARHGLDNEVFLRRPADLRAILANNPWPDAVKKRPNHLLVLFMGSAPERPQIAAVEACDGPERITVIGKEAYIDFVDGVAGSRLAPARLEKVLGCAGTARNWNTIRKLVEKTGD